MQGRSQKRYLPTSKDVVPTSKDVVPTSKDVVVRAVFYDGRARNGHQNASVFLIALKKNIMRNNLVVKCGVENTTTDKLHIRIIGEASFRDQGIDARYLTHEEIMLDCFDLSVKNGSRAFVIYKRQVDDIELIMAESEQPLIFHCFESAVSIHLLTNIHPPLLS